MKIARSASVSIPNGELSFEVHGPDLGIAGAAVICAPGADGRPDRWRSVLARLPRSVAGVAFDQQGGATGGDGREPVGIRSLADAVVHLLDAFGRADAIIMASGLGVDVVADLVERRPERVRAVIVIDGSDRLHRPQDESWVERTTVPIDIIVAQGTPIGPLRPGARLLAVPGVEKGTLLRDPRGIDAVAASMVRMLRPGPAAP
jgi:pimeloyl-ACP methyl ester carboxylesterase